MALDAELSRKGFPVRRYLDIEFFSQSLESLLALAIGMGRLRDSSAKTDVPASVVRTGANISHKTYYTDRIRIRKVATRQRIANVYMSRSSRRLYPSTTVAGNALRINLVFRRAQCGFSVRSRARSYPISSKAVRTSRSRCSSASLPHLRPASQISLCPYKPLSEADVQRRASDGPKLR